MSQCQSSEFRVRVNRRLSLSKAMFGASTSSATEKFNSHVVTTEYRQAVECEARNPCIHDHNDIKNAEGTTEVFFCRTFGALIFYNLILQGFRTACFITCLLSVVLTGLFFAMSNKHRAMGLKQLLTAHSSWLMAHSLLFLNKSLNRFSVFCNNFHEVNTAVQVCHINDR